MTNRLAQSPSLYLRKHAENPIDWWAWCDQALETAAREDKPIFLSIGYSSCHWCTVMEGEAFSDLAIADYMNAHFLPIKVDREERPDLDSIYMQSLQIMTGQGGWPLNVFLTPGDRVPFYGGTYFPVQPRYGRPGFLQLLQALDNFYRTEQGQLSEQKDKLLGYLRASSQFQPSQDLSPDLLLRGLERNTAVVAATPQGPNFPMIPYAQMALHGSQFDNDSEYDALSACAQRGLDLSLGGIYDHVGGGFHRYTVDASWTVPHFEKMLYDNGQIIEFLARLWQAGVQEPAIERAIAGTVGWLNREMTAPAGYFYAAQDADNFSQATDLEPEEGRFYVWSESELKQILSETELAALATSFKIDPPANFEDGLLVLQRSRREPLSSQVESALNQLFLVRYGESTATRKQFPPARDNQAAKTYPWPGRIPPVTDTKMIVAWNGLMISGLATAAAVLDQSECLKLASQAASFILEQQSGEGQLRRLNYDGQPQVTAQAEDYAFLIKALLDLQQADLVSDPAEADRWLAAALKLQAEFDEMLWAIAEGGYYNTNRQVDLLIQERQWMDSATPSANGVAIANLVRLFLLTADPAHLDRAEQGLKAFGSVMQASTTGCPSLFAALDWFLHPTLIRTTADLIKNLMAETYWPTVVYQRVDDLPAGAIALVCQGLTCLEPARDLTQLKQQVAGAVA
ncbi:MAG: thioredoxin domain-containing protein [Aphanocapsa sp. GSE-SYN-MK-11-07L]|jgi:hypothetical protein|nr:thioredoxin domain-containing protein [Aphanocapsa sp. GSE-SYN-MK-11-07L]